jgi:FkbM family methyltransferase
LQWIEKEVFELLRMNTAPYQNIQIFNVGLGDSDQELQLGSTEDSINHGAKTFLIDRQIADLSNCVPVRNAYAFLTEFGVTNPDIIKIDTEGYEYPILKSLEPLLPRAQWVFGELHDCQDFSSLALLDSSHSIEIVRGLGQRFTPFFASRRDVLSQLPNADRKRLLARFSPK